MALEHKIENLKKIAKDFCYNLCLQLDRMKSELREEKGNVLSIPNVSVCPKCGSTDIALFRDFDNSLLKVVGSAQAHGFAVDKFIEQNSTLGLECQNCGYKVQFKSDFKTLADEWNKDNGPTLSDLHRKD